MSIQYRKAKVEEAIAKYPALAIDLMEAQLDGNIIRFAGLTSHQRVACKLAGTLSDWHPEYVAEMCPQSRPPLFEDTSAIMDRIPWQQRCEWWQREHDTPVESLAKDYANHMATAAVERCLEPICRHREGVKMSEHDNFNDARYPCAISEWGYDHASALDREADEEARAKGLL